MYEDFGAVVTGKRVEFRLFLPDNTVDASQYRGSGQPRIAEVRVRGDFQAQLGDPPWDLASAPLLVKQPHPNGWLYRCSIARDLAEGFYEYKYFVTFENETTRWCSDPCAKYGGGEQENSGFTIGGNSVAVSPIAVRLPTKDLVIYELMIDDFTSEYRAGRAPIDAIWDKLDHLQQLGVNAIEFMPWTAWPGDEFSWGYDPVQFFSVEYRYVHDSNAPADKLFRLQSLINELHRRRMHVIMDGVFNHVRAGVDPNRGFGYKWLYQDPGDSPYLGSFAQGGFFDEFNYRNGCVQQFVRDICVYWLDEYQLDGIRFDFTLGFDDRSNPNVGITRLVRDVRAHLATLHRDNVSLMIEQLPDNRFLAIDDVNRICADGCWFDRLMFESFEFARTGNIDSRLLRLLDTGLDFAPGKGPVTYIENHDHSSIVREAGGRGRWFKTQPAAIALLTSPGAVLIRNGQEFGEDFFLPEQGDDRVQPRPLRWNAFSNESGDFVGRRLFDLYRTLIRIRVEHPALRSANFFPFPFNDPDGYGVFPEQDVAIYHRFGSSDAGFERFIVVINYSDFDQRVSIPFSTNGSWSDLLNRRSDQVNDFRLENQLIPSNWGRIYFQRQ
ncbi:MAG TPA: alpha-amylase family glycosyl hydrolase [Polyangiaceae bacterium]|nr:alpha-amylase family glycosyl hydrolase [Polyangiaceae bacterium]